MYLEFLKAKETPFDSYEQRLKTLFSLKNKIDRFFDNVMVNVEDEKIKQNRQNLIASIYNEFKSIAGYQRD